MHFLSGEVGGINKLFCTKFSIGRLFVARNPDPYENEYWGIDNGAYRDYLHDKPFNEKRFMRVTERGAAVGGCQMLVIPDVVGNAPATLDMAQGWIDRLTPYDMPLYMVIQDGMVENDLLAFKPHIDGLFLGGTNRLKRDAEKWRVFADSIGLKFHYGRASSPRKLGHAIRCGSDSADSARLFMMRPDEMTHMLYLLHNKKEAFTINGLFENEVIIR